MTVWYAGLLAGLLILFGSAAYLGLSRYLHHTTMESLAGQAQQISGLLANVDASGEKYVTDEIEEHFAPESRSRFIRVTRPDGGALFESGPSLWAASLWPWFGYRSVIRVGTPQFTSAAKSALRSETCRAQWLWARVW